MLFAVKAKKERPFRQEGQDICELEAEKGQSRVCMFTFSSLTSSFQTLKHTAVIPGERGALMVHELYGALERTRMHGSNSSPVRLGDRKEQSIPHTHSEFLIASTRGASSILSLSQGECEGSRGDTEHFCLSETNVHSH